MVAFGIQLLTNCGTTNYSTVTEQDVAVPVDPSILTDNLWMTEGQGSRHKTYYKFFVDGFMMYSTETSLSESYGNFYFEDIAYEFKWELKDGRLTYDLVNFNNKYEGIFLDEFSIKSTNGRDDLIRVDNEEIIAKYNSSKYNFSPMKVLPIRSKGISDGPSIISFNNPNDYNIAIAVISGDAASYLTVSSNQGRSFKVPNSTFEIYYVTSNEPDALYQGDTVTLKNQKLEITFSLKADGNYGYKRVN